MAPAFDTDHVYLSELGVSEFLPRDADFSSGLRDRHPDGVDAIIDLVSFGSPAYESALAINGRMSSATNAAGEGPGRTNVLHVSSREMLARIGQYLADADIKIPIQATFDLAFASDAIAEFDVKVNGKIAIRVS